MASKLVYLAIASALVAYYFYLPLPENVEEGWKVMFIDSILRTMSHVAQLSDRLGISYYTDIGMLIMSSGNVPPISDENVTVTDTAFNNVPVRLFVPKKPSNALRRAVIYFHGGGWCTGSPAMKPYDLLSRWIADRLNAVVVSVDYRLAPAHPFPVPFEDSYATAKYFLQKEILEKYNVDPDRICVSGDSAGANLAAAVTQQLQDDNEVKVKPKIQALIYPALQTIDLDTPSYRDNSHMPYLNRKSMARFWSVYFANDSLLTEAMQSNTHVSSESNHLIKFANWSNLLPEELKRDHLYRSPQSGGSQFLKAYPGIADPRAAPLLVADEKLSKLPRTYILTCMYDVLRDDGFMYITRLKHAGVEVIHDHYDNAFHGMLLFITWPTDLSLGLRMVNNYINWLNENL
ncbi:arylacetamide deacetylase-like [Ambystoma mexicanum]|uniref:arylacetamide deacetylase-like n=1 Tax=Ambystoma mexicanum TaxID=8296 RepID=UPI0037E740F8